MSRIQALWVSLAFPMPARARCLFFAFLIGLALPASGLDQDLPAQLLEIQLDNAVLRIILEPEARSHLSARVIAGEEEAQGLVSDGPTVTVWDEGEELRLRRAADSPAGQRLQLDLTLKLDQPLVIVGKELDVSIKGPALDLEEMAALREQALDVGGEMPAPSWTEITLDLESSQAELFGLSGALLRGNNTWFISRQSTNEIQVELVGGAAEIEQHRGKLLYVGGEQGSEVTLHDLMGAIEVDVKGGKLELNSSGGKIEGTLADTETRFFDWDGHIELESTGGVVEMRGFRPSNQVVSLVAEGTEVNIEAMEHGSLDLEQKGGKLVLRDIAGKMNVEASLEAEVELERLGGVWKILLTNSELTAEEVERMIIEVYNGKLELEGVGGLELIAHGSDVVAAGVGQLGKATLVNTTASIALTEGARGAVDLQGYARATLRLVQPCVLNVEHRLEADLDVVGCVEGGRIDGGGDDPPSILAVSMASNSSLEVRSQQ